MKVNKEIRGLSRAMLRASSTDGQLDYVARRFTYCEKTASLYRGPKELQASASARIGKAPGQNRDSERS